MLLQDLKDLAWGRSTSSHRPPTQRFALIKIALVSRVFLLLAMAISCHILPNHNPGDDVFKVSLRFPLFDNKKELDKACFCLRGQACDLKHLAMPNRDPLDPSPLDACADSIPTTTGTHSTLSSALYSFLLTPLTRWDASRFLVLAVYPSRRDPPRHPKQGYPECREDGSQGCDPLFLPTEQAHAFFPMLPLVIRTIANLLVEHVPRRALPPTYEGVAVLAALLWNMLSFVLASLALHDLTWTLTRQQLLLLDSAAIDPERKTLRTLSCQRLAYQTFLLFCFNPASVFFTTAYSESFFAACNFGGHALWTRISLAFCRRNDQHQEQERQLSTSRSLLYGLLSLLVLPLWMAASYTRSNGSMNSCWVLLQGIGLACLWIPKGYLRKAIFGFVHCITFAVLVVYPVLFHDRQGYQRHCVFEGSDSFVTPAWCSNGDDSSGSRFSLYGYVQREHWNVGIFRYYTWKKIPNFLLAAPILVLGILATMDWIHASYSRSLLLQDSTGDAGRNILQKITGWAIGALQASVDWRTEDAAIRTMKQAQANQMLANEASSFSWINVQLLSGPHMLAHYAVLAAVCIVGLLVAHIEITTRMICSSCPAIYWYMALCCSEFSEERQHGGGEGGVWSNKRRILGSLVLPYCFLYILLGVGMHPNWLPWT